MRSLATLAAGLAAGVALAGCGAGGGAPAAAPAPAAPEAAAPTSSPSPRLGEAGAWRLVESARQDADGDTGRQSSLLEERLAQLPPQQIADFGALRKRLDEQLYTWDLWGAAYVIEDGCSDDCFRDFRAYVISLGPEAVRTALRDPDALAGIVEDAETGDWENADDVAPDAYEDATGEDIPSGDSEASGEPRGEPWDDEQQEQLVARYPALAARFR